jgi:hypothetical protein
MSPDNLDFTYRLAKPKHETSSALRTPLAVTPAGGGTLRDSRSVAIQQRLRQRLCRTLHFGTLWLNHQHRNPYNPTLFWDEWHRVGGPLGPVYASPSSTHPIYPPPSLVALAPLASLPWHIAWSLLQLTSTTAYLASLLLLARFLPGTWRDSTKPAFLMLGLLFAPAQSALHSRMSLACLPACCFWPPTSASPLQRPDQ